MRVTCVVLLGLSASSWAGITVQKSGLTVPKEYAPRRDAAKLLFTTSYDAYKKYAFGHDDLSPVSESFNDQRNGWGASIVDAMFVMGLEDDFLGAVNFSSQINFNASKTTDTVSIFETTIRYLGGFLSSYELSDYKHPILLEKAKEVADKMAYGWVGNNAIPYGFLQFSTNTPQIATSNIAEAGTLTLEWETLSKYTKNATYGKLATGAVKHIANLPAPLPGLAAQGIDPTTGAFVGGYVSWGGASDSYLEYLLKYARLTNTNDNIYLDTWKTAVDSSIHTLLKKSTVGNHTYLADYDDDGKIRHVGSHLACFHAGNWLLGGKLLQNQTIINTALELNEACWNTYASTVTGIGPEAFAFESSDGNFTAKFYNEHGFYITSSAYILRPEVLDVTGETKYLDRASSAIDAFNKYLPTTVAFAALNDVNSKNGGFIDDMQSFWFAEVLKYLYLTFDDPKHISLDDYVFNTECQPFKAPPALNSYKGSGGYLPHKPFTVQAGPALPQISPNPFIISGVPQVDSE
ncbi:glycoside hydrolase family 47 protein [Mycena albidolilacea]|uniref:alpha-1,2-Mannosidase n=1 Tax=Mycena albidolilacea TaxID=1033008 RepID=A0AAD7AHN7_9AGAR|nr:glycoside hydrolase family 47 protein [Mycena albidolilacea]